MSELKTPHVHTCMVCDRDHLCYGMGCTQIDSLCDECSDADDDDGLEPDHDDSVKFCPDCERPNQFGELCQSCQSDRDAQEYADTHEATDVRCVW